MVIYYGYILWLYTMVIYYGYILWLYTMVIYGLYYGSKYPITTEEVHLKPSNPKNHCWFDLAFCKAFYVESNVFSGREMHQNLHWIYSFLVFYMVVFNHKGLFCQRFLKQNGWFVMISMSVISKHVGSSAYITKQAWFQSPFAWFHSIITNLNHPSPGFRDPDSFRSLLLVTWFTTN